MIKEGVVNGVKRYRSVATVIYFIQWIFAGVFFLAVWGFFRDQIGSTDRADIMLREWDSDSFTDLLNVYGVEWGSLISCGMVLLGLYLLISPFISAGALHCIDYRDSSFGRFWQGAMQFGKPFMLLSVIFLVVFLVWTALVWGPYLPRVQHYLEYWTDERWILWVAILLCCVYCFGLLFLFAWTILIKLDYMRQRRGLWFSAKKAGSKLLTNWRPIITMGFVMAILIAVLYFANLWLQSMIGISSIYLIIVFFVIQQFIVWSKIMLRIVIYSYLNDL